MILHIIVNPYTLHNFILHFTHKHRELSDRQTYNTVYI